MKLRDYQINCVERAGQAWESGAQNVLIVIPTGGGKSATLAYLVEQHDGGACVMAHRDVLVIQLSIALARYGVRHGAVASKSTIQEIVKVHLEMFGRSFYDPNSLKRVASVDTLKGLSPTDRWFRSVSLWVCDEAHHLTREGGTKGSVGKWQAAINLFPSTARGLGVTATPSRSDGKGLGRHADGVMDAMVMGPSMRELMARGYLADYEVMCPPNDLDLSDVNTTATGDYSPSGLAKAVHRSKQLVGDVVSHYLAHCAGLRGVTFAVDIEEATKVCEEFRSRDVPAEIVTGHTPPVLRARILRRLAEGSVLQVISVDVLSEGTDVPDIEVVSFARPTDSLGLYMQQAGRALRPKASGSKAWILDHAGNFMRHGPPDRPRRWSLDRREKRQAGVPADVIPMRACPQCSRPYERHLTGCPFCGYFPEPADRSGPKQVEGDLALLTPEVLARLRGEIDKPLLIPHGAAPEVVGAVKKRYHARKEAQQELRDMMDLWGGIWTAAGDSTREQQKRFFLTFGEDVMSAQALAPKEANELRMRIEQCIFAM